ncbi:MAG: FtsW/RodA/SpoVE family cell cycle protein [Fusicatenibacter sp.]|nr:FtsW/RodA/SpoVE family cell cycle protein [Fusicatenibacter sp.]
MLKRYKLKNYNFRLILWLISISVIGVMLIGSADSSDQKKQAVGVVMGVILMIIVSLIDYSWVLNFYWVIYVVNLLMLGILYVGGDSAKTTGGATRWIQLGGFQFQPTELSKILLILFFAMFLMKHEDDLNTARTIFLTVFLLIPPLILIYRQPDLKNTITVCVVFCIMMFAAGLSYKVILAVITSAAALILALLLFITQVDFQLPETLDKAIGYQLGRIETWLNPDDEENSDGRLQQENSITAIGSGQLTGKGLNNNKVSSANKGNFVSQNHNDFIFAVAGEELGFLGCCLIIFLLFLILLECIIIARKAKDLSGTIICCGVAGLVAFQSFLNISVATGILPNTGTPLPFVSYGLTSLLTLYIGMGFVLNVGLQNRDFVTRNDELLRRKTIYEHRIDRA